MANQSKASKVKKSTKREFEVSAELKTLAEEVITKESLTVTPAKIDYLLVYPYVSKTVMGVCKKSGKEFKFYTKFDYLIEMSGDVWDALPEKERYILMHHELLHVMPVMNEKKAEWEFKIRDHDVKDFASILKKHGIDWAEPLKAIASSVLELEPKDVDALTA